MNFNKIRVVFLAIFLGVSLTLTSQSSNNADYQSTKLNTFNGYNISNPSSAIYDDLGWLWITGNSYQKDDFVIGENKISIQRFDGVNFYDLEIPKSEHKPTLAMFIKMSDGFLVMISYENFSRTLFRIDYQNLTFTEIPDFNRVDNKKRYVGYFTVNNESIFVFNTADKVLFYKIKNNQFIQTDSASKFDKGFTLVTNFISNPKKTAIVNLGNQLSFLIYQV